MVIPRETQVPTDVLRKAVMRAVLATSLRQVARDVGMSPTGLDNFLVGLSEPYSQTRRKLESWYVRQSAASGDITGETITAALAVLLDGISPDQAECARERIMDVVRTAHRDGGTQRPAWTGPEET